ncbi:MAG: hypothetical protein SVR08_04020 [Spirochaetota bacterium]|nr:hypothetical protein [Spirochaetota bacterium]
MRTFLFNNFSNDKSFILSNTNIVITIFISVLYTSSLFAQLRERSDFIGLYNKGDYSAALEMIKLDLNNLYVKDIDKKKLPEDIISLKKKEESFDINILFRKRRAKGFFIEENSELSNLHLYAARCYFNLSQYEFSLNHYFQAIRYKSIEFGKDDVIFYEISKVYKKFNFFNAYVRALEAAYTLNPNRYDYSKELGKALYTTTQKKKAIYHLERYIKSKGDEIKEPKLYLQIGNLNEDIGRYLETVRYYKKYLKKNDDGYIYFALGYLAYKRIGNYNLAIDSFNRSLKLLPENDIYRRSKVNEYKGDIYMKELEFEKAADFYNETIAYQERIKSEMRDKIDDILKIKNEINSIKSSIITSKQYDKYDDYENLREKKGIIELEKREKDYEFNKLNAGKIRWNLAESYERMGKLNNAIKYYREAISYDHNSNKAREKIIKLRLKIKRGY